MRRHWLAFALALAALSAALTTMAKASDPCARRKVEVVIDVDAATMVLCRAGKTDAVYPVNLGRGGVGKRRQGDRKTPLGSYALAKPRKSNSGFTWFVPIGYPTDEQRAQGYTGGAIGIHGPPDWMPQAVVDVAFETPWTDGCIMVRTRAEIDAVRAWLLEHRPRAVEIVSGG